MKLKQQVAKIVRAAADFALEPVLHGNEQVRLLIGQQNARSLATANYSDIRQAEFRVFSQWGEDGIIQYLIQHVPIADTSFIEFGVESYAESNTRFLLLNDNWRGLIIDGGTRHQQFVRRKQLRWRYELEAVSAFVTRENVNDLFSRAGFTGDIGILSIDIDGNDYWVWESVDVVKPRIVIAEYNATFGPSLPVTIPYQADFDRNRAHYSSLYWGSSLGALCALANRKGMQFVGTNSAGNNAFFVRKDLASRLPALTSSEGFAPARFRESRDAAGQLSYITSPIERLRAIADKQVVNVVTGELATIAEHYREQLALGAKA